MILREPSDSELVQAATAGDRNAFDQLVERYAPTALVVALAYVKDPDVAEDVAQDSFLRAWRGLDRCADPGRFGAWLRTIVRRTALNLMTKSGRREKVMALFGLEVAQRSTANVRSAERALDTQELGGRLQSAIGLLAPRQREVLLLHDLEGRPHAEIADLLGITPSTSRKHLSDARRSVRTRVGKEVTE